MTDNSSHILLLPFVGFVEVSFTWLRLTRCKRWQTLLIFNFFFSTFNCVKYFESIVDKYENAKRNKLLINVNVVANIKDKGSAKLYQCSVIFYSNGKVGFIIWKSWSFIIKKIRKILKRINLLPKVFSMIYFEAHFDTYKIW